MRQDGVVYIDVVIKDMTQKLIEVMSCGRYCRGG
jgi:hypothetical protein